jgi:triphosphoribosyl-dephospho-CoA synthase
MSTLVKAPLITTRTNIAQAAQLACLLEVSAPKPGNVNRLNDFADARFADFVISAVAIGPAMESAARSGVGQTIWRAIRDTQRLVRTNTNLGMVLLLAPLVKACAYTHLSQAERKARVRYLRQDCPPPTSVSIAELRDSLVHVLAGLTIEDAQRAYAAIRAARPGGLGKSSRADVASEPTITLYQAMALAQERDAIAREYAADFAITFEISYPARDDAWRAAGDLSVAIVQAHLTTLARVPDTLIARKRGMDTANQVSRWADDVLTAGGVFTSQGQTKLAELDRALRDDGHTLNPGTTADLTAAAIFLLLLHEGIQPVAMYPEIVPGVLSM